MLVADLYIKGFPSVHMDDTAAFALQLMDEYDVRDLPVCDQDKFIGIVSKVDLLDLEQSALIGQLQNDFRIVSLQMDAHFTAALKLFHEFDLSVIPVINESKTMEGALKTENLIRGLYQFLEVDHPGAIIGIQVEKIQFSLGELCRLVETNNAYITQMNSYIEPENKQLIVTLKLNRKDITDIVATLKRYEYNLLYYFGEEHFENELKENYDSLMTYLNV